MTNKSMSDFQFKEFLRLVTAKKYLLRSEVMQSYRKEILLEVSPKLTTILNIYVVFPGMSCDAEGTFLKQSVRKKKS